MKLYMQLNFGGNCEEAFRFYENHLGGKVALMMNQSQAPGAPAGGEIFMPLQETFFATRFSMLRDRFGMSWTIIHELPRSGNQEVL